MALNWAFVGASTIAGQDMAGTVRSQHAGAVTRVVSTLSNRAAAFAQAVRDAARTGQRQTVSYGDSA
jgi:predicted dehydrogenase